jgi:8-oxo-dGTP diphosphatase
MTLFMTCPGDTLMVRRYPQMPDIRTYIYDEIAKIQPFDAVEEEHRTDALAWIANGAPLFRIKSPDKPPKHLVSYFVLIDPDHQSILLGDHIKAQLWLPSGGHVMQGEDPKQTVLRESREELSKDAVFLRGHERPLFVTSNQTVGLTPGHTDISLWYVLRGSVHEYIHYEKRELNDVAWFTFDEILDSDPAIFDRHMQRFTRKLIDWLARATSPRIS